jgi:hypothetical protein
MYELMRRENPHLELSVEKPTAGTDSLYEPPQAN